MTTSTSRRSFLRLLLIVAALLPTTVNSGVSSLMMKPLSSCPTKKRRLKVYVLAGQSNMVGHGEINSTDADGNLLNGTLLYQVHDPRTRSEFEKLWDADKEAWVTLNDVQVWYNEAPGGQDGVNGSNIPGTSGIDYSAGKFG